MDRERTGPQVLLSRQKVFAVSGPPSITKDLLSRLEGTAFSGMARRFHGGYSSRRNLAVIVGSNWREDAAFYLVLARWRSQLRHNDARCGNLRGPRLHLQSDGSG